MDAYDIFKKLSRGAKFKTKRLLPTTQNFVTPIKKIKLEDNFEENINGDVTNDKETSDVEIKSEPEENSINVLEREDDKELVLLGSMTVSEKGKKKREKVKKEMDDDKRKMLEQEQINHFRNLNSINVVGKHAPTPLKSFDDLEIGKDLKENIIKCGYSAPTVIQMQAIPVMLNRRQILACAPTGSGKTAAFLLPILHHLKGPQKKGFRAVIVCPTRELAKQTQRECVRLSGERGFRVHVISKINQALVQYGPKSNQKFDILVTTPNRVCFLLNQEPQALSLANVEWLVIDEADKLFEEGLRGFRDQLNQIMKACTSSDLRIAMFSATQTVDVGRWCKKNLKNMINVTIGSRNSATDLVDQELLFVGNESGKLVAFRNIVQKGLHPPVLVFVQSKDRAQQLFQELIYDGINVDVIHADRTQLQRDNTVRSFREGKIWVLICTELLGRGIDFKGVNLVVNYDFPPSAITYIHRIGRAGRAGRKGRAITFFTTDDTPNLRSIAHVLKQSGCQVPEFMLTMKKKRKSKKIKETVISRVDISTKPNYVKEKYKKKKERQNSNKNESTDSKKVNTKNETIKSSHNKNNGKLSEKMKFRNKNKVNKVVGNKKGSFKEKLQQQGLDKKNKKNLKKVISSNKLNKKLVKNK